MATQSKKFDYFNFFYGIGAVIILCGVTAKFLEVKYEDEILIVGLITEALVFFSNSFKYIYQSKDYKWEKVFPHLINDATSNSQETVTLVEQIQEVSNGYLKNLKDTTTNLENIVQEYNQLALNLKNQMAEIATSAQYLSAGLTKVSEQTNMIGSGMEKLEGLGNSTSALDNQLNNLCNIAEINNERFVELEKELANANKSMQQLTQFSRNIINSISNANK